MDRNYVNVEEGVVLWAGVVDFVTSVTTRFDNCSLREWRARVG